MPRALVNPALDPAAVRSVSTVARSFHEGLPEYAPTPVRELAPAAQELGLAALLVKDESDRLGLPAFKALGASWAIERALADRQDVDTLVAASAGNHGRAVARMASLRGLACRIFVPARSVTVRRDAIASEGAAVIVVDGGYETAVAAASQAAEQDGALEISDVGTSQPALDVIDGYATLFDELSEQAGGVDVLLVPVGVGSLAAAGARFGAETTTAIVGVEPVAAPCLTASLAAGRPVVVGTPGTTMAGMDCAEISRGAWPSLSPGIAGTVLVEDSELAPARDELRSAGVDAGECSAATLAAARTLASDPEAARLREAIGLDARSRVAIIASEGPTSERI